ncbi:CoA ester lyase [Rhodococcus sp. 06-412-2C]|uniref:HpcH/HpaI aldolase/citrate lyase family protein n=1 Tax=unclassified Rhodococcus (in: high G+C Gram-positive bacteria) TaxID=192944 RepID=UPI000B9B885C|nr:MULTISPECIES: CoA ester lyase [unclassified Rhodococcus (in: high G+C Gram-positive bacteria)]OZC87157.1 CoA ester lyase [Rhodococcus sp. 06-412-2C]OZD00597.1 CoA ester lyase [Rhodococcus sp. 06-412-2B]
MNTTLAQRAARAQTFLFVPGTQPDRFDKAVACGADLVILDLEDAVAGADKDDARSNVVAWLRGGRDAVVRVNSRTSPHWKADIAALVDIGIAVMVPKADDPAVLAELAEQLPVIALVETARGVLAASAISSVPGVVRTALGHIDLAAELGVDPGERQALLGARSSLVLAAAAAGIDSPIDGVTTNLSDPSVLESDVRYAKSLGFSGKLCIHPSQIGPATTALTPTRDEVAWAERITAALPADGGVASVDGHMVDPPVLARATRILATVAR